MTHLKCLLAMAGLGLMAWPAFAQVPLGQPGGTPPAGPVQTPAFSPYLNLTRQGVNGTNPAINYYGIVKPQTQFASQIQSLQNQAGQINPFTAAAGSEQPVVTGNAFGFQNYRNYFQNQFTAGGFGSGIGFGRTSGSTFGAPGTTLPGAATGQQGAAPSRGR